MKMFYFTLIMTLLINVIKSDGYDDYNYNYQKYIKKPIKTNKNDRFSPYLDPFNMNKLTQNYARSVDISCDFCTCKRECIEYCEALFIRGKSKTQPSKINSCIQKCVGDDDPEVQLEQTTDNLVGSPTSVQFEMLPGDDPDAGNRMFVTTQDGTVQYSEQGPSGSWTTLLDISAKVATLNPFYTESGLLSLAFHPDFKNNGYFYVVYGTEKNITGNSPPICSFGPGPGKRQNGTDRTYVPNEFSNLAILEEYLVTSPVSAMLARRMLTLKHFFGNHLGIDSLMFSEEGDLLMAVGDGGCFYDQYGIAQKRNFLGGKVLAFNMKTQVVPKVDCYTPVLTTEELELACPETRDIVHIYAEGIRNAGHMSLDRHQGITNRYIAQIGQNNEEAIFKLNEGSNLGWVVREGTECTCLKDDPAINPRCDFEQTFEQCDAAIFSTRRKFDPPIAVASPKTDRVSSIVGGHVYRGNHLPCSLRQSYIFSDWSQRELLGFPAAFQGEDVHLWFVKPDFEFRGSKPLSKGRVRIEPPLEDPHWIISMGMDPHTNDIYVATYGSVSPISGIPPSPQPTGRIYKITPPDLF